MNLEDDSHGTTSDAIILIETEQKHRESNFLRVHFLIIFADK